MTNKKSKSDLSEAQIREVLARIDIQYSRLWDVLMEIPSHGRRLTHVHALRLLAECFKALGEIDELASAMVFMLNPDEPGSTIRSSYQEIATIARKALTPDTIVGEKEK